MSLELKRVLEKDAKRYRALREIYRGTKGEEYATVADEDLAKELGVNLEELYDILTYLEREGLVSLETMGGPGITHSGIREVEASIRTPSRPTPHFSVPVIQHVTNNFHAPVGAVQTGNHNTANVTQNIGVGDETLLRLLEEVRSRHLASLSEPQRRDVTECLDGIAAEAQSSSPSKARLRALVQGTTATLKDFGVQVGANLLAGWLAGPAA